MSNLLSMAELSTFVSGIRDHFETFSSLHTVVVIKEPKKVIINNNDNVYPGYEMSSNLSEISFVPISGTFNAMVFSSNKGFENLDMPSIPTELQNVDKVIKVNQEAKDYIEQGQTERIIVDNLETYIQKSQGVAKNYGNVTYYYFALQKTS